MKFSMTSLYRFNESLNLIIHLFISQTDISCTITQNDEVNHCLKVLECETLPIILNDLCNGMSTRAPIPQSSESFVGHEEKRGHGDASSTST